MSGGIKLRLDNKAGSGVGFDAAGFEGLFRSFRLLVASFPSVSNSRDVRLVNISMNSPILVELAADEDNPISEDEIEIFGQSLSNRNFEELVTPQAVALHELVKIASSPRRNVSVEIGRDDNAMVKIDRKFQQALESELRGSEYIGTIDGRLEQLNIHDPEQVSFTIYPVAGNKITARAPRLLLDQVASLLGYFVEVHGVVECRRNDPFPHSIRQVSGLKQLGEKNVNASRMIGELSELYAEEQASEVLVREWRDEEADE